jgi:hypothetical protein
MKYTIPIYYEGIIADEDTFYDGLEFPALTTIEKIIITAREAPTGANLTIDLLKDGVEVGAVATLTAGSLYEETNITDVEYTTAERLGLITKSIGSIIEGSGINVLLSVSS